jgi:predicted extracellular nuclease
VLNDRPPLVLLATARPPLAPAFPLTVIVNHLRSLTDVDDPTNGAWVRAKRAGQAEFLARLIQGRQAADPSERIISLGDYNAYQFNDGYVDVIGTVLGDPAPASEVAQASPDLVDPDLVNLITRVPPAKAYSYVYAGSAQTLSHLLVTTNLLPQVTRVFYAHLNADFPQSYRNDPARPERLSDHDAAVVYLTAPAEHSRPPRRRLPHER